jgi:hypothetical protein
MDPFKKTVNKTQDLAKRAAKIAGQEIVELGKSTKTQLIGVDVAQQNQASPIVEAMKQGTQDVSEAAHEGIHADEKRKLTYLQDELELLRRKNEMEVEQGKITQEQAKVQGENILAPLSEPVSKPERGSPNASSKQKQGGTHEMVKPPSG